MRFDTTPLASADLRFGSNPNRLTVCSGPEAVIRLQARHAKGAWRAEPLRCGQVLWLEREIKAGFRTAVADSVDDGGAFGEDYILKHALLPQPVEMCRNS